MSFWDDPADTTTDAWVAPSAPKSESFKAGPPPDTGRMSFGGDEANNDARDDGPRDNTCRYCHEEGHMARECPKKPANDGGCFNCGEHGHNKSECPNPRKFTGVCRHCAKEGHAARECPERSAMICRNCLQEGHSAAECTEARKLDLGHIKDRSQEEAWNLMKAANDAEEFDEFKTHMLEYIKASPGLSLDELEMAFRHQGFRYYLYALTVDVTYDKCLIGPHGELGCKYIWTLNKTARPRRSKMILHRMAATPEENVERLKLAGTIEQELGPFCHQCKSKGHIRATCEVEVPEDSMKERVVLKCSNCQGLDHRIRDCPEPRKNFNACRNCGEEGHRATDCTNPRVASGDTECRGCGGKGHFSKDCPERKSGSDECFNCGETGHRSSDCTNERVPKCRNCDERGHISKECPKPRDITRVKCNQCGEMGHFSRNCTKPAEAEPEEVVYGGTKTKGNTAYVGDWGKGDDDTKAKGNTAYVGDWGKGDDDTKAKGDDDTKAKGKTASVCDWGKGDTGTASVGGWGQGTDAAVGWNTDNTADEGGW